MDNKEVAQLKFEIHKLMYRISDLETQMKKLKEKKTFWQRIFG